MACAPHINEVASLAMAKTAISTACILAERALEESCGSSCVEWATGMLVAGFDTDALRVLAGESPPFNHFEIAALRDAALAELRVASPTRDVAVATYAAERLRAALDGEKGILEALAEVADLRTANDHQRELAIFYDLHYAYADLLIGPHQHYYDGANHANIAELIVQAARDFVEATLGREAGACRSSEPQRA